MTFFVGDKQDFELAELGEVSIVRALIDVAAHDTIIFDFIGKASI